MNQYSRRCYSLSALLFITGCSAVDDPRHLENAKQFLADGDLKSAQIELKNALQQDPEDSAARIYLGQLYLKGGNYLAAEKELTRAKELGGEDNALLPSLSQAQLRLRKFTEVLATPSDHLPARERAEVLASKGIASMYQGDNDRAVELTEQALGIAADSTYVRFARAKVHLGAEQSPAKAREQLKHAFEIDRDYAPAWSLLGDIEVNAKQLEAAREAYTRTLELQPGNVVDLNKRVTVNILMNDLDTAQQDLDILKKQFPGSPGVAFSQALIHLAAKRLNDAKLEFDLALLDQDRYPMALFYLAYVNYRLGNFVQAESYAERYFSLNPAYLPNRKLLAEIKFKQEDYTRVEALLKPVLKTGEADDSVLNIMAKTLLMKGETSGGIALLNQIVERNPDSAEARFRLGAGLLVSGDESQGFAQIETAIADDANTHHADDIYQVLSYLKLGHIEKAYEAATGYRKRAPESEIPYNLIGMVHIAQRDFKGAQQALEQSWQLKPGNADAGHNLATLAILDDHHAKARDYLEQVRAANQNNLETVIKLAELDALEGNPARMIARLEEAIREYPAAVAPRLVLARYFIRAGKPAQVSALIETLDLEARKLLPVMDVVGNQAIAQKRYKVAEKTANEIIIRHPERPEGYFILAQAYAGMDRPELAEQTVEKAIQRDEKYLPARIVMLHILVKRSDIPAIEREIALLKTLVLRNEDVMKAEFILEELKGNQPQALALAERLFGAYPTLDNMLSLSRQKLRSGDSEGALALKVEWAEKHSDQYEANMVVALTYTQLKQDNLAVKYYQRALSASPDDHRALNNLAWALRTSDPQQALLHAQRVNQLKPGSAELMDTLAMVYLANQERDRALRTIKEALYLQPENPTLRYHEAMINATSGNEDSALRILTDLLDASGDFPEKPDAVALFEKLKRG